jgi:protein-disulfide isomerase
MEFQGQKTEDAVMEIVRKAGLNAEKIKAEMKSAKVTELLQANHELGRSIGVNGTPAFIIGGNLTPGAMGYADMKAAVEAARKK